MPVTPDPGASPLTLLAFDYGSRRIGVAVGQQITGSASPVGTTRNSHAGPDWQRIDAWVREWSPQQLVVGMPTHADGTASDTTRQVLDFMQALKRYGLPCDHTDERYTSIEASEKLRSARADGRRRRLRKEDVDAAAAVLIAERWLAENS